MMNWSSKRTNWTKRWKKATVRFQAKVDELDQSDKSRLLTLAASLILVGSILGMASGALILNGNPDDLLGFDFV